MGPCPVLGALLAPLLLLRSALVRPPFSLSLPLISPTTRGKLKDVLLSETSICPCLAVCCPFCLVLLVPNDAVIPMAPATYIARFINIQLITK